MSMQIPMGLLADKKSRRLALALNITSTILYWDWILVVGTFCDTWVVGFIKKHNSSLTGYFHHIFPTWCLYLAPAFILIGGGPWATGALVFAAINDKVTSQQR